MPYRPRIRASLSLLVCPLLVACGLSRSPATAAAGHLSLAGTVHGGQQPIAGATIQIYAAGSTGDGSAATPMMCDTVTTSDGTGLSNANANQGNRNNGLPVGNFNIDGDYPCGASNLTSTTETYLVATGGNPGLTAPTNNAGIALMVTLGQYGTLSSINTVEINEITTVGSLAALYPYATSYSAIGSGTGDVASLMTAFNLANTYMNLITGQAPGGGLAAGQYASTTEIVTLADIVSGCINSAGGASGDSTMCGNLFLDAKPATGAAPTETIGALLQILNNPTRNVAAIFALLPAQPPFQPTLTAANADWTLPVLAVPSPPTFSPGTGTYTSASVTAADSTAGTAIHYTADGSTPTIASPLYTGPIAVSASQTLKAVAIQDGRLASGIGSAAYTVSSTATPAATPTISPAAGTYAAAQQIALSSTTPGAAIYFTVDGSSYGSGANLYTGPFTVYGTGTVNATAVAPGYRNSAQASASYAIQADTILSYTMAGTLYETNPSQQPDGIDNFTGTLTIDTSVAGTLITGASVTFSNGTNTVAMNQLPGGQFSGLSSPGTSGQYSLSQPITDGGSQSFFLVLGETVAGNVNAGFSMCVDPENLGHFHDPTTCNGETRYTGNSNFNVVATGALTPVPNAYVFTAGAPTFLPVAGTYQEAQSVALTSSTPGMPIYYTLDGSIPTIASSVYSTPIPVTVSETITAFAGGNGDANSAVVAATYTIQ